MAESVCIAAEDRPLAAVLEQDPATRHALDQTLETLGHRHMQSQHRPVALFERLDNFGLRAKAAGKWTRKRSCATSFSGVQRQPVKPVIDLLGPPRSRLL